MTFATPAEAETTMSKTDHKIGEGPRESLAPLERFQRGLRQRADEIEFLAQHVFPHPATPWRPTTASGHEVQATQVIRATLFGPDMRPLQFFITRPFTIIGRTLMGGLQPDRTALSIREPLRLSLCTPDGAEIETETIVRGDGEFHLSVELDQDVVTAWLDSSHRWQDSPDSIPFGLVLRPEPQRDEN
jgi:hypothetical protein